MKKRIVITGGHLTPALAVIEELIKEDKWEIFFLGRRYASDRERTPSVESLIIPDRGLWFFPISAGRFPRYLDRYAFLSLFKIPLGFLQAFYYLLRFRPRVILSFGGYVSVPVVLAGWLLRIPSLTHEQTAIKGLATRINAPFVKKIAVSWSQTVGYFSSKKVVLTGNPIRKEVFEVNEKIWRLLKFEKDLPLVFITGGNQGSHVINKTVEEILPQLVKVANVFHQCGHLQALGDFEKLQEARGKLSEKLKGRYHVRKYLNAKEMGTLLNKAGLIVARSGANNLTEIAALGKPALFIPYPWLYQDEQTQNAQMLVDVGIAEVLPQKDLSGKNLLQKIETMIQNRKRYEEKAPAAKKTVKLQAARGITAEIGKMV